MDLNELLSHNLTISFDPLKDAIRQLYDAVEGNRRRITDMERSNGAEPSETKEDDAWDASPADKDGEATDSKQQFPISDNAVAASSEEMPSHTGGSANRSVADLSPLEHRISQLERSLAALREERSRNATNHEPAQHSSQDIGREPAQVPAAESSEASAHVPPQESRESSAAQEFTKDAAPPSPGDATGTGVDAVGDRVRSLETAVREIQHALHQRPTGRSDEGASSSTTKPSPTPPAPAGARAGSEATPTGVVHGEEAPPTATHRSAERDEALQRLQEQVKQIQARVNSLEDRPEPPHSSASAPVTHSQDSNDTDTQGSMSRSLADLQRRLAALESSPRRGAPAKAASPSEESHAAARVSEPARPVSPESVAGSRRSHESPRVDPRAQEALQGRCDRLDDATNGLRQQVGTLEDAISVLKRRLDTVEPRVESACDQLAATGGAGGGDLRDVTRRVDGLEDDAARVRAMVHCLCTAAVKQARVASSLAGTAGDEAARSRVFRFLESLESSARGDGRSDDAEADQAAMRQTLQALHEWMDSIASRTQAKADASDVMQVRNTLSRVRADLDALQQRMQRSVKGLEDQMTQVVTDSVGVSAHASPPEPGHAPSGGGGGPGVDWSKLIQIIDEKADRAALEGLASIDQLHSKVDRRELAQLYRMVQQLKSQISSSSKDTKPSTSVSPDSGDWAFLSGKPLRGFHCLSCGRDLDRLMPPWSTHVPPGSMPVAPLPSHTVSRSRSPSPHRDGESLYGGGSSVVHTGESTTVLPNGQVLHRHSPERPRTSQSVPGQRSPAKNRSKRPATTAGRRKRPQTSVPRALSKASKRSSRFGEQGTSPREEGDDSGVLPPLSARGE